MTTRDRMGVALLTVAHLAALVGPAVVVAAAARKGGLPSAHGLDLVLASAVVAVFHGRTVWRRLIAELRRGKRALDAWIAAGNGLVVLAAVATGVVFVGLGGLAPEHAAVVNKGWHVLLAWTGLQLVAVALAEATHRGVFRWLEAEG